MNKKLQDFARKTLKEGLSQLTEEQQLLFKRMYSPKNLDAEINEVVDAMEPDKFNWAMQQVQRTLDKKSKGQ